MSQSSWSKYVYEATICGNHGKFKFSTLIYLGRRISIPRVNLVLCQIWWTHVHDFFTWTSMHIQYHRTSRHGEVFRITGPYWGKSIGPTQWFSNASEVVFIVTKNQLLDKHSSYWWFETMASQHWCDETVFHVTSQYCCIVLLCYWPFNWIQEIFETKRDKKGIYVFINYQTVLHKWPKS